MNYDINYYVEQLKLRESLKGNLEKLAEIKQEIRDIKIDISSDEKYIENKKKELDQEKKSNRRSKFLFFKRDKSNIASMLERRISDYEKKIVMEKNRLFELSKQYDELQELITKQKELYKHDLGDGINLVDGVVTINDKGSIGNIPIDEDQEVIVHCTNFFPHDKTILCNYDGNKKFGVSLPYKGVLKGLEYLSHRHTCHFTINCVVTSTPDGKGTWKQPKYIIVEPREPHKQEFVSDSYSDSWTYGSVVLGDNPTLLVRDDEYDNIPKENLDKFNIIKYSGEYSTCLKQLLKLYGIKQYESNAADPGHSHSFEMSLENSLNYRNMAINYVKDNSWDGKSEVLLSEDELYSMYEILCPFSSKTYNTFVNISKDSNYPSIPDLSESFENATGIDINFLKFIICFGIQKKDNNYNVKDDDTIYQELNDINKESGKLQSEISHILMTKDMIKYESEIRERKEQRLKIITDRYLDLLDLEEARALYEGYKKFQQRKALDISKDTLLSMRCSDLYKFENIDYAKKVVEKVKKLIPEGFLVINDNTCSLNVNLRMSDYNFEKMENVKIIINEKYDKLRVIYEISDGTVQELLNSVQMFVEMINSFKIDKNTIENNDFKKNN